MARVANLYSSSVQPVLLRQTWQSTIRAFSTQFQFDKDANYYSTLGLRPTATQAEIKKKFHELAKKYHPDAATSKPSDEERFKKITSAYDILSNDVQKRAYDAARNPQRQQQQASGRRGGGHEQDFASQWAKKEQTYTFNRGGESANQRTHAHGQQSYDEWKRTQKDDDKYNYFYHDARSDFTQDNRASGRRGDSYQTGSSQFKKKKTGQKTYGDVYGQQHPGSTQNMPKNPHVALGMIFFGLILANIFVGVLTGRGQGRDFNSRSDQKSKPPVHSYYNNGGQTNNDPLLAAYHGKSASTSSSVSMGGGMIQGSNVISSTFLQPTYKTNVPGRVRMAEDDDGSKTQDVELFKRQSGGIANDCLQEELKIRKAGNKPSKEFLEEKKRLFLEKREKRNIEHRKRAASRSGDKLYSKQEEYLSNIAEVNKINAQMGMPIIRTEVRYLTASMEPDVPNLQSEPGLQWPVLPEEKKKRPAKGKKGAKKKASTAKKEQSLQPTAAVIAQTAAV